MIAFEGVSFSRGARNVLEGLSFAVEPGTTLALVGRSGAGKSTVLKLINRMLEPSAGCVYVEGRDTREWRSTALRRRTGYVPQHIGLFPHMSVGRNIAVVPRLEGWAEPRVQARVQELLELIGLPASVFADRYPDELSGGQQQRVGVARALAADPPVLLMDEPFGALDPITRAELHREFAQIQQRIRKTIVLVTHDLREAMKLADKVGVLDDGRLVACSTPDDLPSHDVPAVQALLGA